MRGYRQSADASAKGHPPWTPIMVSFVDGPRTYQDHEGGKENEDFLKK